MSKKRKKTSGRIRKSNHNETAREVRQALKAGQYDRAIIALNTSKAKQLIPDERRQAALAEAHFRRGLRYRESYPREATQDLLKAVDLQPEDPLYSYHLGLLYHHQGDLAAALKMYRNTLALDDQFQRAALPLLLVLRANGASTAELQAEAAWAALNYEQQTLFMRQVPGEMGGLPAAMAAMQRNDIDQAEAQFGEVLKGKRVPNSHKAFAYDYLGRIAASRDDLHTAMNHWQKAQQLGHRDATFLENLALLYVLQAESHIAAGNHQAAFDLAEQANANALDHPRLADIHAHTALTLGYDAARAGNWNGALRYWHRPQMATGPSARALAANMGLAYEAVEDYGAAADAWRDFVKRRSKKEGSENYLTPEQVGRLWSRVSALYAQDGQIDEAVDTLRTALKHDPDNIEINLQFARRLAEAGSIEAAHNQIERMMKMAPDHIEVLVLRAELWELEPPRGYYSWDGGFGIPQWEDVLNAGDEAYASLAKQHLENLYLRQVQQMILFGNRRALSTIQDILKKYPDLHEIRVSLIELLYSQNKQKAIWEEINKLDLTNLAVLHQLIDTVHIFDQHADAEKILNMAEEQQPLTSGFYEGVAYCAIDREQPDIAQKYFEAAIKLTDDDDERKNICVKMAQEYYTQKMYDQARELLDAVLEEDPGFGPAHLGMAAIIHNEKGNKTQAKRHLRKARSWGKKENDEMLLMEVDELMFYIDNPLPPLGGLPGLPSSTTLPPELRRVIETMSPDELAALFGGMLDDRFDDDDEEDFI